MPAGEVGERVPALPRNSDGGAPELLLHVAVGRSCAALVALGGIVALRVGHADLRKRGTLHRAAFRA